MEDSSKEPRRKFSKEFKLDAIRLIGQNGKSAAAVARDLGIEPNTLYSWRRDLQERGETSAFPGHGRLSPEDEELRRLRRENERLDEENRILKKAMGYFARHGK